VPILRETRVRFVLLGGAAVLLNAVNVFNTHAAENFWTGAANNDWNNPGNWSLGRLPIDGDNAHIDISGGATAPFRATIFTDIAPVSDIRISRGVINPTNPGILNHIAGSAATGAGNWIDVGTNGGSGTYNLADVNATGGTLTGFGIGSGSMTTRRIYVGGVEFNPVGGTGVVNMNTTGSLNLSNDLVVGVNGGRGTFNLDAGTLNVGTGAGGGWVFIGAQKNGSIGSNGVFNMSGGILNNGGAANRMIIGDFSANGTLNMTGGNLINGEELWIGQEVGSNGFMNIDAGSVQANNWFVIGRSGGTGTLTLSGGTVTKGGGGNVILGSLGGKGRVNQSGGTFNTLGAGGILFGENAGANTLWDLSAGTVQTDQTLVDWRGGTNELRVRNGGSWTTGILGVGQSTNNGKGVVNQTGGTITSNVWIAVGMGSSQQAEYNINGGTTNAAGIEVGAGSAGLVSVSATGVLNITNAIEVPSRAGSGTFNITGGTVNTVKFEQGGRNTLAGTGVTNQSGGLVRISGNLDVERPNVGSGTYNLSGGTLSVNGAINLNGGSFNFTGGMITRSNPGTITFNGALTTGTGQAGFDLDNNKIFDINGAFNKVAGLTLDLTGITIPVSDGVGIDTGLFLLGRVNSMVGTFDPATDTIFGLTINNPSTTFVSEDVGEGGLFDRNTQSVFWIHESGGNVLLRYSLVPEQGCLSVISLAGAIAGARRRRK
jgi:hypothetical protein